ncbi:MAG: EAL domain-containing protein [Candidatus Omnitrophica bacterium]|nr:EAL domain-containing protein [Candidatus Omnitrophota bacterium]
MADDYHKLLKRQIRKHLNGNSEIVSKYEGFLSAVNLTYFQTDEERELIERSLDISSRELLAKNAEIETMIALFPDAIIRIKRTGEIIEFHEPVIREEFLYPEDIVGSYIQDSFGDFIGKKYKEAIDELGKTNKLVTIEYWIEQNDKRFYFEARLQVIGQKQILVVIRNFTDHIRTMEALRRSEQRYALSAAGANDGLWDWDLINGSIYFSSRWKAMLGYEETELRNSIEEWYRRIHPHHKERFKKAVRSHQEGSTPHLEIEYQMQHKNGSYIWVLTRGLAVSDSMGNMYRMAGSQTDITRQKIVEEQLRHDALHDRLTALPNRALFMNRLENCIERAKRNKDFLFAILFIDLDRFKVVNDSLGHLIGDELLVKVSHKLKQSIRAVDTVARLGGDEFIVLLDGIKDAAEASHICERILKTIAEPVMIGGQDIYITASIGITLNTELRQKPEDMLRDADTAMYRAKNEGKAHHQLFDEKMHQWAMDRLHLETDLRRAADKMEFEVYYQPIVDLHSNKVIRMEALLRWQHPERGLVYPMDFIPLAEETGLIIPIGEWVLDKVCRQSRQWQKGGFDGVDIAVNFSARQFEQGGLPELIQDVIAKTGVEAFTLEIEITESIAMKNIEHSIKTLTELKELGMKIAIDDFGVGYSSFGCLKYFPIDHLKIDRTFIRDIPDNKDSKAITRAMISLTHALDLHVVAEGVETAEQLAFLKDNGCDSVQGYFFAKPMPVAEATKFLEDFGGTSKEGT